MSISENIRRLQDRIETAALRADRSPSEVKVLLVTKFIDVSRVKEAYDLGFRAFGENRVQELVNKREQLPSDIEWHMIGRFQTNKAKYITGNVELIQSLDRDDLAVEIQKAAEKKGAAKIPCLVQVNSSDEPQKGGIAPDEIRRFLDFLAALDRISIRGLMTLGPLSEDESQIRGAFQKMRSLQGELSKEYPHLDWRILSMGMSGDFEIAIEEGSTMIRVGSLIFGAR